MISLAAVALSGAAMRASRVILRKVARRREADAVVMARRLAAAESERIQLEEQVRSSAHHHLATFS